MRWSRLQTHRNPQQIFHEQFKACSSQRLSRQRLQWLRSYSKKAENVSNPLRAISYIVHRVVQCRCRWEMIEFSMSQGLSGKSEVENCAEATVKKELPRIAFLLALETRERGWVKKKRYSGKKLNFQNSKLTREVVKGWNSRYNGHL